MMLLVDIANAGEGRTESLPKEVVELVSRGWWEGREKNFIRISSKCQGLRVRRRMVLSMNEKTVKVKH